MRDCGVVRCGKPTPGGYVVNTSLNSSPVPLWQFCNVVRMMPSGVTIVFFGSAICACRGRVKKAAAGRPCRRGINGA